MVDFVLKMMEFILKMMDFILKLEFPYKPELAGVHLLIVIDVIPTT